MPPTAVVPLLPGVSSRQEAEVRLEAPTIPGIGRPEASKGLLPIPGIGSRQQQQAAREKVVYVTNTVTTPIDRPVRGPRRKTGPVPLASLKANLAAGEAERQAAHPGSSTRSLPKWVRSKSSGGLSASGQWVSELQSSPSSLASSLNSGTLQAASMTLNSAASFKWAPEQALVQSWHRRLQDRYHDYSMVNIVGEGRHGAVFIVEHKLSGKAYACKLLQKGDHNPETLRREIETLRKLDHPNIVRLYETNEDGEAVFLLMELCQGGDLFSLISGAEEGHLPEKTARIFAEQMLSALAYCHAVGIVHRDVKPENFLLETEDSACQTVKLADFGIATFFGHRAESAMGADPEGQVNGSIPYMAPEMFLREWKSLERESKGDISLLAAGDMWSCGVVIYVMLSGDLPYGDSPENICSGDPPDFSSEVWQSVSSEAKDLILKLLVPDLGDRWTASHALRHEWFRTKPELALPDQRKRPLALEIYSAELPEGAGLPENRQELARQLLRHLRRWRRIPFLRRISIAAVAKRLEAEHPTLRYAQIAYWAFNPSRDGLRCEQLVQALNTALCEAMATATPPGAASTSPVPTAEAGAVHPFQQAAKASAERPTSSMSSDSLKSTGTSQSSPSNQGKLSLTGLHVRARIRAGLRRLSRLSEETPTHGSPVPQSPGILSPGLMSADSEDLVSLTELKYLVSSLDGMKNGLVDYTLLVAAVLPPEVYCEELRVREIFEQFDFKSRGVITPEDLQTYLGAAVRSKDNNIKRFMEMVAEFDLDGDGALDLAEFRQMLRSGENVGDANGDHSATASATPMTDSQTPSRPSPMAVPTATPPSRLAACS